MYAAVCSADVQWGTTGRTPKYRTYATFWNTLWVILGCTKQPLDRCVKVPNVRPFCRTLTAFWAYKYSLPLRAFHELERPSGCQSVPRVFCECFVSVCEVLARFETFCEAKLLQFCFKEVTFDL